MLGGDACFLIAGSTESGYVGSQNLTRFLKRIRHISRKVAGFA